MTINKTTTNVAVPLRPLLARVQPDRKHALADTLRQRILSMTLAPGAVVDELALCDEFGLSRPPVRELLRQMAAEGYVELEANRAPRVATMSHDSFHSFFLAAPLIYIATTQLAATHASVLEVERLKAIQTRFRQAVDHHHVERRVMLNNDFHLEIGLMARNDYLLPSLRRLLIDHTRLGKIFYRTLTNDDMQRDCELACQQHDQMIDAIERRDPEAAGQRVREHFEVSRRRMAEYAAPQGVVVPLAL